MTHTAQAGAYMRKAQRALVTARLLFRHDDTEGVCNRAYYAMFNAAHAALLTVLQEMPPEGYKTHRGLIAAFGKHVVQGAGMDPELGRTFGQVAYFRELADYQGEPPPRENAAAALAKAEVFVEVIRTRFGA